MKKPSAVLVTFPFGEGTVVHAISHFHLQGGSQKGKYVSAFILTNVIEEAINQRHASRVRLKVRPPTAPKVAQGRIRVVARNGGK